jgi:hypothetical protein
MMSIGRNLDNQFLVSCMGLACQNSADHRRLLSRELSSNAACHGRIPFRDAAGIV